MLRPPLLRVPRSDPLLVSPQQLRLLQVRIGRISNLEGGGSETKTNQPNNSTLLIAIIVPIGVVLLLVGVLAVVLLRRRKNSESGRSEIPMRPTASASSTISDFKSLKNVKVMNRLGGGNFGDVYKGVWNVRSEMD